MKRNQPPRLAVWLLRRILVRHNRTFIVDDLTEEYGSKIRAGCSALAAHIWFWRQLVQSIGPSLRDRAPRVPVPGALRVAVRDIVHDVRYSLRALKKSVGYTTVAVLTLALGIGANTAVFTVVNGVLLRPLVYPDQDRLVTLWSVKPADQRRFLPSYPDYHSWGEGRIGGAVRWGS
jgi:hypothetical protein